MNNNTKSKFKRTNNKIRSQQVEMSNERSRSNFLNGGKVAAMNGHFIDKKQVEQYLYLLTGL